MKYTSLFKSSNRFNSGIVPITNVKVERIMKKTDMEPNNLENK